MKVLVVGSVPPPLTGRRQSLLAEVLRLRREGHEVQIVGLDPLSAAHRYLSAPGIPAATEVGLLARKADAVVLQIEPGLPVRLTAGRLERAAALLVLSKALSRKANVTLRVEHLDDLPGGPGGRAGMQLWAGASRIEVGDDETLQQMLGILGPHAERVSLMVRSDLATESEGGPTIVRDGWGEGADTTAGQVQAVVRARAAEERQALAVRGLLLAGEQPRPRVPQWQWLPTPGAGVPDLGPIRLEHGRYRARGRQPRPRRSLLQKVSVRRAATWALASAERRPLTRPAAHLARTAYLELRGGVRH
ncbi:MAG: hypothetical protein ABSE47_07030 [Acidimicrobiales bacterium]|jgi:hypothetical protein